MIGSASAAVLRKSHSSTSSLAVLTSNWRQSDESAHDVTGRETGSARSSVLLSRGSPCAQVCTL